MIYKIGLYNRTSEAISVMIGKEGIPIKINSNETGELKVESTLANLYVKDQEGKDLWSGAVPSNTFLEIMGEKEHTDVYLEDDKIPAHTIDDECSSLGCNNSHMSYLLAAGVAFLFLMCIFVFLKMK